MLTKCCTQTFVKNKWPEVNKKTTTTKHKEVMRLHSMFIARKKNTHKEFVTRKEGRIYNK